MNALKTIWVRGAPNLYICEEGVLNRLPELLQPYSFRRGLVLRGERSWQAAKPFFPELPGMDLHFVQYEGECSEREIARIAALLRNHEADFLISIGGGKVLDIAKAAGNETGREVVLIPTLAATCAAWTPLSVIYNEQGQFLTYTIHPKSTLMVLVEPRIILHSPVEYLRSGIGDTLAKWYEAEILTRNLQVRPIPVQLALKAAETCKEVLLEDGTQAIRDMENAMLTPAFLRVIETIIISGGMVGGFGDQYGRVAAAHSIHNGLTVREETHHLLHGEKVAYGILIQLSLEKNQDEIKSLLPFYQELNLPCSLKDLGLSPEQGDALRAIANRTLAPEESIHFLPESYTPTDVMEAMLLLESLLTNT
jgi:uncharacterized oxidoreductase